MRNRYLHHGPRRRRHVEVPQYFWMRVAMGLSLNEDDATEAAIRFYRARSPAGVPARWLHAGQRGHARSRSCPTASSCRWRTTSSTSPRASRDVMWLTKGTGGIGLSVTKLRSEGSPIRSQQHHLHGPDPVHAHDRLDPARGQPRWQEVRRPVLLHGELAPRLPAVPRPAPELGDPYRRTRTANTAVWISDEFMKRGRGGRDWYLFDPLEDADLVELYGAAFSQPLRRVRRSSRRQGQLRAFKQHQRARAVQAILIALQTALAPVADVEGHDQQPGPQQQHGHDPPLQPVHRDHACRRTGTTRSLQPGIGQPRSAPARGHARPGRRPARPGRRGGLGAPRGDRAHGRAAARQPHRHHALVAWSSRNCSNDANRAMGLGVMGFTDVVERLGLAYEQRRVPGAHRRDHGVRLLHRHRRERRPGARAAARYPNFAGSGWSQGRVPFDTIADAEADRGCAITVDRTSRLDWDALREKVAGGMRNATLMAVAPTASIGLVAGTTPGTRPAVLADLQPRDLARASSSRSTATS